MDSEVKMKPIKKFLYSLHPLLLSSIATVLTIAQIVLVFFLRGTDSEALEWVGWICLWVSGIFGMLPIFTFRKKGGVREGENYMKTTRLVDTGVYAIVRHPQGGTAWLLINLGVMLIAQHWTSVILGVLSMILAYADTYKSDQYCIQKFGSAYEQYIEKVPRLNFFAGIMRLFQRSYNSSEDL